MWRYVVKRLITLIPLLLAVSFIVFFLMSFTGDPALTLAGDGASQEDIENIRESLGLNDPLIVRYARHMWKFFHGDMGTTLYGTSVWDNYIARFPNTLKLAIAAMIVSVVISIPFGILAAVKHNSWIDNALSATALCGVSLPGFWLGLMMMVLFSVKLGWLPSSGDTTWKHLIMPAICLGLDKAAGLTRTTRSAMVDVIRADYLRTARAKGVSERDVIAKHAFRNALVTIMTTMGAQFVQLISGASVIESLFAYNGLGCYVVESIRGNEFTAATNTIIIFAIMCALILLCVDVLYAFVDPRIKARYTRK